MKTFPPGAIFCRTCGYCLYGLPSHRCPECGHDFDPADRKTFLARPRRVWVKRTIVWGMIVVLALAVAYGGLLGWLYWGWKAESGARALVAGDDGRVETTPALSPKLSWLLVGPCRQWQERIDTLIVSRRDLSAPDVRAIAACHQLRRLHVCLTDLKPEDIAALCACQRLEDLSFSGCNLTPAHVAPLSRLERLQYLDLTGNSGLTDAAVAPLSRLTGLRQLWIIETSITRDGFDRLRAALPACHFNCMGGFWP